MKDRSTETYTKKAAFIFICRAGLAWRGPKPNGVLAALEPLVIPHLGSSKQSAAWVMAFPFREVYWLASLSSRSQKAFWSSFVRVPTLRPRRHGNSNLLLLRWGAGGVTGELSVGVVSSSCASSPLCWVWLLWASGPLKKDPYFVDLLTCPNSSGTGEQSQGLLCWPWTVWHGAIINGGGSVLPNKTAALRLNKGFSGECYWGQTVFLFYIKP